MELFEIAYLIANFVAMLAIERVMGVFFDKRRTSFIITSFSYLLYFVFSSIAFLLWNIPVVSMLTSILTILIITLCYESSTKKKFVAAFGSYVVLVISDIVILISIGLYQTDVFDTLGADNTYAFIIWGATTYVIALFFRKFKNIRKNTMNSPIILIFYSVCLIATIIMLLFIMTYLPQNTGIIATVVMLGVNVFIFYLHDALSVAYEDKLKSALYAQEKDYYFAQCQLMQESVARMKLYRHDVKFHLATLKDFTADNKAATDYLNTLLGDIGEKEIHSDTGNIAFDSIINFKLKTAAEDNIKIDVDVLVPPALNIEVADVVTILGNLLDNALDAVAKVEDKIIKLNIEASKGNLFIKVDNTFDGEVKYSKGKDGAEKNIVTRKSGDNHGYGLKNIRRSVEKYNGHVDINHDGNIFSVGVLMYVDDM